MERLAHKYQTTGLWQALGTPGLNTGIPPSLKPALQPIIGLTVVHRFQLNNY